MGCWGFLVSLMPTYFNICNKLCLPVCVSGCKPKIFKSLEVQSKVGLLACPTCNKKRMGDLINAVKEKEINLYYQTAMFNRQFEHHDLCPWSSTSMELTAWLGCVFGEDSNEAQGQEKYWAILSLCLIPSSLGYKISAASCVGWAALVGVAYKSHASFGHWAF